MKQIKELIINNYRNSTAFYKVLKILFSLAFSAMLLLDKKLVFSDDIFAKINEVYFTRITLVDVMSFVGICIATYILLTFIEICIDIIGKKIWKDENTNNEKQLIKSKKINGLIVYFIIFILLIVAWSPYILSAFPAGIYGDTGVSINQSIGISPISNNHPLMYTLSIKAAIDLFGGNVEMGMALITVIQILIMAAVYAYFIYWLYKRNVSKICIALVTAFFMFFNLIPLYVMSNWKDSLFSAATLAYIIGLTEIIYQDAENLKSIKGIMKYVILMFFVAFMRNNGIYIVTAVTIWMLVVYRKRIKDELKKFTIISTIAILLFYTVQGPVYKVLNLNGPTSENIGIPLQQICYVVASKDGKITDKQKEFINQICPIEVIEEKFTPYIVDSIKWNENYNEQFVSEHLGGILKIWAEIFIQNPKAYIVEYLLNTLGYWDINKVTNNSYINYINWGNQQPFAGVTQIDIWGKITGHSIQEKLAGVKRYSAAIGAWIVLLSMMLIIKNKKYKNLIILLPAFLTWATIMIATPIAFTLRYVYIVVLTIPLSIIVPTMPQKPKKEA